MKNFIGIRLYRFGYWVALLGLKLSGIEKANLDKFWYEQYEKETK